MTTDSTLIKNRTLGVAVTFHKFVFDVDELAALTAAAHPDTIISYACRWGWSASSRTPVDTTGFRERDAAESPVVGWGSYISYSTRQRESLAKDASRRIILLQMIERRRNRTDLNLSSSTFDRVIASGAVDISPFIDEPAKDYAVRLEEKLTVVGKLFIRLFVAAIDSPEFARLVVDDVQLSLEIEKVIEEDPGALESDAQYQLRAKCKDVVHRTPDAVCAQGAVLWHSFIQCEPSTRIKFYLLQGTETVASFAVETEKIRSTSNTYGLPLQKRELSLPFQVKSGKRAHLLLTAKETIMHRLDPRLELSDSLRDSQHDIRGERAQRSSSAADVGGVPPRIPSRGDTGSFDVVSAHGSPFLAAARGSSDTFPKDGQSPDAVPTVVPTAVMQRCSSSVSASAPSETQVKEVAALTARCNEMELMLAQAANTIQQQQQEIQLLRAQVGQPRVTQDTPPNTVQAENARSMQLRRRSVPAPSPSAVQREAQSNQFQATDVREPQQCSSSKAMAPDTVKTANSVQLSRLDNATEPPLVRRETAKPAAINPNVESVRSNSSSSSSIAPSYVGTCAVSTARPRLGGETLSKQSSLWGSSHCTASEHLVSQTASCLFGGFWCEDPC